ncbi:unnamed protein product [Sphenostylis stenocarpa]|uniref:Uncharacterized protein n=1 Tax=Sphenostylis stenocarpa TaxID=92480 RepID=A0AA86VBS1_9FABA|nr:unnamed protein product [Sphenostylis stenocarpa]
MEKAGAVDRLPQLMGCYLSSFRSVSKGVWFYAIEFMHWVTLNLNPLIRFSKM